MDINDSMDEILRPITNVEISITEEYFRNEFLPLILRNDTEKLVSNWLTVCKNPYYSVKVKNKKGVVVLIVPPIFKRQHTRTATGISDSFAEIMERSRQKSEVFYKKGDKYFKDCMNIIETENRSHITANRSWRECIEEYLGRNNQDEASEEVKRKEPFKEDFEYEDL